MKAKQLVEILNLYPEADLKIWNDDVASVIVKIENDNNVILDLQRK